MNLELAPPKAAEPAAPAGIACALCRHASGVGFEGHGPAETRLMMGFKTAHAFAAAGSMVADGSAPILFTLYSGWALRLRVAAGGGPGSGAAAILGLALPGDLIGLETVGMEPPGLAVRALTDVTLCRFDPARLPEWLAVPSLAERIRRAQAIAIREAEARLAAATTLAAAGNLCHFLLTLFETLKRRKLVRDSSFHLPLSRQLLAATIGLTSVHLRRILHDLAAAGVMRLDGQRLSILDPALMAACAGGPVPPPVLRPLL